MARTVSRTRRRTDEEDEQPTRGRARNHDEEGGGRRRRPQRDSDEPTFDPDEEDDEDEQPRRRRTTKVKDEPRKSNRKGKGGWGSVAEVKSNLGDYAKDFKAEEGVEYLVKFVDEEPYDVYAQHWIERSGKRSFTCGEETYDECPLCDLGDKPSAQIAFNIIVFDLDDEDADPSLFRWIVGAQIGDTMMEFAKDPKTKPINGLNTYFSVKRTKKDKRWNTKIQHVKARDLDEDFGVEPLTQDEIDDLAEKAYDYTSTEDTPLKVLNDIADELA